MKSTKFQAPTSREAPNFNIQIMTCAFFALKLGAWNFFGAWMLALGA
jgi:hypothetical protein